MSVSEGTIFFCTRAWLRSTWSDILNAFKRPQPAIKERCHVHSGELEAGKATRGHDFRRFQLRPAVKIRQSYWMHFYCWVRTKVLFKIAVHLCNLEDHKIGVFCFHTCPAYQKVRV